MARIAKTTEKTTTRTTKARRTRRTPEQMSADRVIRGIGKAMHFIKRAENALTRAQK